MVEKVFEGNKSFARKTITDIYDLEKIMMELKFLDWPLILKILIFFAFDVPTNRVIKCVL